MVNIQGRIQIGFPTGQPVWDSKLLSQINKKLKMFNTVHNYIIITFSIVNNPHTCYLFMFITENYSSKFTIMPCWAPTPKSPTENGIPKNSLGTSLIYFRNFLPSVSSKSKI